MWVASPEIVPSVSPTDASAATRTRSLRRQRVEVLRSDPEHEHDWDHEVAAIDPALERLAGDDEHEQQVDEVIGGGHRPMIDLARPAVVGARVELQVDPRLNP